MKAPAIDTTTRLYGVFGNPVAHSLGPRMHNAAFAAAGIDAVYLAFRVADAGAAAAAVRTLEMGGASVTLPHKESVLEFLDEVDEAAAAIGAANTIVNRAGRLAGANTDAAGAVAALAEKTALSGRRAVVVGAGGVARALVYGLHREGAQVTVVNRTRARGERLARDLALDFRPIEELNRLSFDVLVNATPVGMHPRTASCPVNPDRLPAGAVVMDTVYNPMETRLLRHARRRGCSVVDGLAMFVHQGVAQFELWTGQPAPATVMARAARAGLSPPPVSEGNCHD